MNKFKEVRLSDYGFFILSPSLMKEYLFSKKIKGKKILDKFENDKKLYLDSISKGIWLPISSIDAKKYIFCASLDSIPENTKSELGKFNLSVGDDDSIWIGSLGSLNCWDYIIFENEDKDVISYKAALTGQVINKFIKFEIPKGKYKVTLTSVAEHNESGYFLYFSLVDEFKNLIDPRDDIYSFNIG
ncbi:hypothetical protein [Vibrio ostreae]|uniref:Uncharacterized protein n=1 Tax=Vibrio ostreae TaxID=2841925 RepID=A0A975YMA9_9VIBR|nr:hypothetical protein [Vibrio ostreae]QXO16291.1 hypothetical protein KNV97_01890 [Vibrio ostreae]